MRFLMSFFSSNKIFVHRSPSNLRFVYLIFSILLSPTLYAQNDNDELSPATREYIENVVADSDSDFDFDDIFDALRGYRRKPLNLNQTTEEELSDLGLLNSIQINALVDYRKQFGQLIDIRELQAIPQFDLETINRILPYVTVRKSAETFNVPIGKMLYTGRNDLRIRYSRRLELARGYMPVTEGDSNRYAGSPGRVYARFKHSYENRHSWGITMEKDPGEDFFRGSNKAGFDFSGFDFYSAHLYYRNISRTVKAIALGDYQVSLGQGLIVARRYGIRKSSYVTRIRSSGRQISPYTSINESVFFRGLGGTLALSGSRRYISIERQCDLYSFWFIQKSGCSSH